ncbi:MAG: IclR family transcriptional regulator, partial [Comamonadaceae bacterium]
LSAEDLRDACLQSRAEGSAIIQNRVSLGVRAVGVAFQDSMGQAVGALSVAALTQRLNQRRTQQIASLLRKATQSVEVLMRKRTRI